ncbi:hypothetical protein [Oerskovia enterophila]|uniref:hypothetical protein n=1 Tax=Oerskovia enterophila TaxID=43678 RepID=UPI0008395027
MSSVASSWVTTMVAAPVSRVSRVTSSMIWTPRAWSSADVGSSTSRTSGWFMRARAIATR